MNYSKLIKDLIIKGIPSAKVILLKSRQMGTNYFWDYFKKAAMENRRNNSNIMHTLVICEKECPIENKIQFNDLVGYTCDHRIEDRCNAHYQRYQISKKWYRLNWIEI